MRGRNPP